MNSPLYNKLIDYSSSKMSFHMPGHKFGTSEVVRAVNLALLDNTEVIGMDNLYEANGVIKQAMDLMADFYGSLHTLFLTNGSTAGILASIMALCKDDDKVIVARNSHHSVWHALILSGAVPIYLNPRCSRESYILGEIVPEDIKDALEAYPDAKGVIIVSPTYEGIVSNIQAIAKVVHDYGKVLIVDEAHGAHFALGDCFPSSSTYQGADIVINSMHKTLPALTQSALIHICSDKVSYESILSALRMIQTSSPSYMMMGLMDYIRAYILENRAAIRQNYIDSLMDTRKSLRQLKHLKLIEMPDRQYDISKIVISAMYSNIDGYKLAEILNNRYNVVVEAALKTHIILMTTMADTKKTLDILRDALIDIDNEIGCSNFTLSNDYFHVNKIREGISLRKVYHLNKEWISIKKCENKVNANTIMLYPPGVPMICIGEVLTKEYVSLIYQLKEKLQGIKWLDEDILIQVMQSD